MESQLRKSHTSLSKIYFWTATIHKWLPLLENDINKQVVVNSLKYLSDKKLITVYAFDFSEQFVGTRTEASSQIYTFLPHLAEYRKFHFRQIAIFLPTFGVTEV